MIDIKEEGAMINVSHSIENAKEADRLLKRIEEGDFTLSKISISIGESNRTYLSGFEDSALEGAVISAFKGFLQIYANHKRIEANNWLTFALGEEGE